MHIKRGVPLGKYLVVCFGAGLLALAMVVGIPKLGRSSPIPGLSIRLIGGTNIELVVTNGVTNEFYEIYSTNGLQSNTAWSLLYTGYEGVTSFLWEIGPEQRRYFKARSGKDWDGDGIENYRDADGNNSNVGQLFITIESPTNNATIH